MKKYSLKLPVKVFCALAVGWPMATCSSVLSAQQQETPKLILTLKSDRPEIAAEAPLKELEGNSSLAPQERNLPRSDSDRRIRYRIGAVLNRIDGDAETVVRIRRVEPNSPASEAGLLPEDVVVAYGRLKIESYQSMLDAIDKHMDRETNILVKRNNEDVRLLIKPFKVESSPTLRSDTVDEIPKPYENANQELFRSIRIRLARMDDRSKQFSTEFENLQNRVRRLENAIRTNSARSLESKKSSDRSPKQITDKAAGTNPAIEAGADHRPTEQPKLSTPKDNQKRITKGVPQRSIDSVAMSQRLLQQERKIRQLEQNVRRLNAQLQNLQVERQQPGSKRKTDKPKPTPAKNSKSKKPTTIAGPNNDRPTTQSKTDEILKAFEKQRQQMQQRSKGKNTSPVRKSEAKQSKSKRKVQPNTELELKPPGSMEAPVRKREYKPNDIPEDAKPNIRKGNKAKTRQAQRVLKEESSQAKSKDLKETKPQKESSKPKSKSKQKDSNSDKATSGKASSTPAIPLYPGKK